MARAMGAEAGVGARDDRSSTDDDENDDDERARRPTERDDRPSASSSDDRCHPFIHPSIPRRVEASPKP
jgi:hypothetical protein